MRSVVNERDLLNFSPEGYDIKGTTDIIVLPKVYEDNGLLHRGIQIAIELKTTKANVDKADRRQGLPLVPFPSFQ